MRSSRTFNPGATAIALALGLSLAGCGGMASNRSMNSVHQPVVEKVNYTFELSTSGSGLAYGEQGRLTEWFDAMGLKYGDKVFVDDPGSNPSTRSAIDTVASRYGIMVSDGAPQTGGYITPGAARVVIVRSKASVPGCPDWSAKNDFNPNNGLSSNYGCATNANLAAMIANPEDLLRGSDGAGATTIASSNKAIEAFRKAEPTGKGNALNKINTKGD